VTDQRIKAVVFRNCHDCPFSGLTVFDNDEFGLHCGIAKNPNWWWSNWGSVAHTKDINNPLNIPDWCPLPDIVEVVKDLDDDCEFRPYW
jgi:hypothetical protein